MRYFLEYIVYVFRVTDKKDNIPFEITEKKRVIKSSLPGQLQT